MRIGIVTRRVGRHDGQGRVNLEIAREALRQGHAVQLFAEDADAEILDAGARLTRLPPPAFLPGRLLRDQLLALRSATAATTAGCDALLANGFCTWARAEVNAVHFVHRAWLAQPQHPARGFRPGHGVVAASRAAHGGLYSLVNARLEQAAFRRARRIVAVSDKLRAELIASGIPAARIETIRNGVDTMEFAPSVDRVGHAAPDSGGARESRAALGLPEGVLALFAGDLRSPRKNLDGVLTALAATPGLHLAIAGRHEDTPWPAMTERLGVAGRTHFLGFRRDMPALMRSADLFVFPSRYEACSLVLLEALASGLPVVTAASAGGAEMVTPEAGIVLPDPEDQAALAAALRRLAAAPDTRAAMAQAARAIALRQGWSAMAQAYLRLLETEAQARLVPARAGSAGSAYA